MSPRLILCYLSLVVALSAATEPSKEFVSLSFSVVSWGNAIPDLYYKSGSKNKEIPAPSFEPSALFQYKGPAELVLYRDPHRVQTQTPASAADRYTILRENVPPASADTTHKPKEEQEIEVARVLLPANESRVTLLMTPTSSGSYQCFAIPGDPKKFPYGQAMLLNLYNQPLTIRFNRSETVRLNPKESKVVAPNANSSLLIEVAAYQNDKWKRLLDNIFTLHNDEQVTVIFSRGDYEFFRTGTGDVGSKVHVTVLRQKKE